MIWGAAFGLDRLTQADPERAEPFVLRLFVVAVLFLALVFVVWLPAWLFGLQSVVDAPRGLVELIGRFVFQFVYDGSWAVAEALRAAQRGDAVDAGACGVGVFAFLAGGFIALPLGRVLLPAFSDWIAEVQEWIFALFIGPVDRRFPRPTRAVSRRVARARRDAINGFLDYNRLSEPVAVVSVMPAQHVHEIVERHQEINPVVPKPRVVEFLETPSDSQILGKRRFIHGLEEIAGQNARLRFEAHSGTLGIDETLVLLLARVVDAALLADRHLDAGRKENTVNAMPFFDCIYVDHRPFSRHAWLDKRIGWLLGPVVGEKLPARVVIETNYGRMFEEALFYGKDRRSARFSNWFGIGIQIERPRLPQTIPSFWQRQLGCTPKALQFTRKPSSGLFVCRQLRAHAGSGVSQPIVFAAPGATPARSDVRRVVTQDGVADGCPSAMKPRLLTRGLTSNAPPITLFEPTPTKADCRLLCMQGAAAATNPPPTITIDLATMARPGRTLVRHQFARVAASDVGDRFVTTGASPSKLSRKVWVGAFFERELRQANRFPVVGCRQSDESQVEETRPDLRGRLVTKASSRDLAGVFVSIAGPQFASNLLLPEGLLAEYLAHLEQAALIEAATLATHTTVDDSDPLRPVR